MTISCCRADDKLNLLKHELYITRILRIDDTFRGAFSDNRATEKIVGM